MQYVNSTSINETNKQTRRQRHLRSRVCELRPDDSLSCGLLIMENIFNVKLYRTTVENYINKKGKTYHLVFMEVRK